MLDLRRLTLRPRPRVPAPHGGGFSLIEVVIVVVILGIVAAIALPRLSRGSSGSADTATVQNAAILQKAVDLYAAEHCGSFPKVDQVADQLTMYTDGSGTVSHVKTAGFSFGPYVHKVPPIPTGPNKGSTTISDSPRAGVAWVYNAAEGAIAPNLAVVDGSGAASSPTGVDTSPIGTVLTTTTATTSALPGSTVPTTRPSIP